MNITHTTTDELDSILREIESHSLETLLLKSDRRANIFTASQANSERAKSRVLELPKTLSDPLDALNEKISALNSAMAEKEKELALLENRDHKLHEQVQRSYATVEKLKERKYLGRALLEATRENSDVIDADLADRYFCLCDDFCIALSNFILEQDNESPVKCFLSSHLYSPTAVSFALKSGWQVVFVITGRIQEEKQEIPHLLSSGDCLDEYVVSNLISIGGFGQVYTGYHRTTHMRVAIKVETLLAPIPLLRNEAACLHYLNSRHNEDGRRPREPILRYMAYGKTEKLKYLVMDHSGANLRELKRATPKDQFSMTTSLWIMERMLSALQFVHGHGWLHRDIKPANFCIGDHESHKLYLIDFGMCRYFLNTDGSYKMRKPSCPFHGTVRYASLNSHKRQVNPLEQCCVGQFIVVLPSFPLSGKMLPDRSSKLKIETCTVGFIRKPL
ncbi:unnamed protein product [Nippostrongylus brasiliensis]|uniref:Protein kinase domain-containing protein n=1 Tax=Nippostrongylus brasiliensis TaxID=27835 RepID=A0A0N4YJL3_NIPBR|nr:unnamed protein product [Nippostrongylus brasiliensis]